MLYLNYHNLCVLGPYLKGNRARKVCDSCFARSRKRRTVCRDTFLFGPFLSACTTWFKLLVLVVTTISRTSSTSDGSKAHPTAKMHSHNVLRAVGICKSILQHGKVKEPAIWSCTTSAWTVAVGSLKSCKWFVALLVQFVGIFDQNKFHPPLYCIVLWSILFMLLGYSWPSRLLLNSNCKLVWTCSDEGQSCVQHLGLWDIDFGQRAAPKFCMVQFIKTL